MKKIVDINAKDGVLAVSYFVEDNSAEMKIKRDVQNFNSTQDTIMMAAMSSILDQSVGDDLTVILPESVAIRAMVVRKAVKEGKTGDSVARAVVKKWMPKNLIDELSSVAPMLATSIAEHKGKLQIMKARQLYRWELSPIAEEDEDALQILADKKEITLTGTGTENEGSRNEEIGIMCRENNYLNGTFSVISRKIGQKVHYYVERVINVIDKDGNRVKMTTAQASTLQVDGADDSGNNVLNMLTLRTKNAEALPRVIRKTKITIEG